MTVNDGKTNVSNKKECLKCGKPKDINKNFYISNSNNHMDGKYPICKVCIKSSLKLDDPMSPEAIESLKNVLLEMNRPFMFSQWQTSVEESSKTGSEPFGKYLKNVQLNFKDSTWKDSEFESSPSIVQTNVEIIDDKDNIITVDNRDKDDVIRMLGYDPFEHESELDRKYLYSRLLDFLSEDTLEDGFKLQAVIEIVTGFNQIDKINQAITFVTNDINKLSDKSGGIQSLITAKKNILTSLLGLAKDNGISVNNNNQKSKGAGTLSGIIKVLQEKGINEADINTFDIETCEGMRQVADISNKSILEQLMLNENDYTEMIKDQKELITNYERRLMELEEENRLIKVKLKNYEDKEMIS